MDKVKYFYSFVWIFFLLIPLSSANFACGSVITNSTFDISPAWLKIKVSYENYPTFFTTCKVSPSENKYCCDPLEIKEVSWKIGENLSAKLYEVDKGLISNLERLTISGNGYDLFSDLFVDYAVKINSPYHYELINNTNVIINISNNFGLNNISYILYYNNISKEVNYCLNCVNPLIEIGNLSLGKNKVEVIASNGNESYNESVTFFVMGDLNYNRKLSCEKCFDNFAPSNSNISFEISINNSYELFGDFIEFIPNDWGIIYSDGGEIGEYNQDFNFIKWQINSSKYNYNYVLKSPDIIITRKYSFFSKINNYGIWEGEYAVYRFSLARFISFSISNSLDDLLKGKKIIGYEKNNKNSEDNPLVIDLNDNNFLQIAVFPNKEIEDSFLWVYLNPNTKMQKADGWIGLLSNIASNDISYIYLNYYIDKKDLKGKILTNFSIFYFNSSSNEWDSARYDLIENNNSYYFNIYSPPSNYFSVKKEFI